MTRNENSAENKYTSTREYQEKLSPGEALKKLKQGNERFLNNRMLQRDLKAQVNLTAKGQYPFAAVVSCIDSRIPVVTIFDQGIGDLVVGRVSGNIITPDLLGSLELAVSICGVKLLVVMGHTYCEALMDTIDKEVVKYYGLKNLNFLLDHLNQSVESVIQPGEKRSSRNLELLSRATVENVKMNLKKIRENSPCIADHEEQKKIILVGAIYDLQSGEVKFLVD